MGDVGDVLGGVGKGLAGVGGAGFGEGLGDAKLWGDDGVGEGAGVLVDGGVGSFDELSGRGLLLDKGMVDGVERLDGEVVLEVGVDGGAGLGVGGNLRQAAKRLRENGEGRAGPVAGGGKTGGGEDGFELAGADDGIDFGDVPANFVAVALDEAAGDDELLGSAAVGDLVLDHFENGVDGLLLGGIDEGASIDDEDVGVFGGGGEVGAIVMQEAHHDLGVDEVLGAAEGDEADLGFGLGGDVQWRADGDGWGGGHSLVV